MGNSELIESKGFTEIYERLHVNLSPDR